jgi:hypothetical protein
MDQMVSAQPGLISQMAGFLTNLCIWEATVFVDHFSDYVYMALTRDLGLDKTLLAKSSFEWHANEGGVSINAYCTNNGCFADAGFQKAIIEANQSITFLQSWCTSSKWDCWAAHQGIDTDICWA